MGTHMARALSSVGREITFVLSASMESARRLAAEVNARAITDPSEISTPSSSAPQPVSTSAATLSSTAGNSPLYPDLILLCVPDKEIERVATSIPAGPAIVAHTSGTTALSVLKTPGQPSGVFYPLQTFNRLVEMTYDQIPLFIEGSDQGVTERLWQLANAVSRHVYREDSPTRMRMHIAAVFAANFSNHLVALAEQLLERDNLPREVLDQLLEQTWRKIRTVGPRAGQTGPAIRGDQVTLDRHMESLGEEPQLLEIYKTLTQSIQSTRTTGTDE